MRYHILREVADVAGNRYESVLGDIPIASIDQLKAVARGLSMANPDTVYHLVQEIGRVAMEPVVTIEAAAEESSGLPAPTIPHHIAPHRDGDPALTLPQLASAIQEAKEAGPARDPQVKPRLLVINRRATGAELVGHLMVVAEGRIVKNAFGPLELEDMPLTEAERPEVLRALGQSQ